MDLASSPSRDLRIQPLRRRRLHRRLLPRSHLTARRDVTTRRRASEHFHFQRASRVAHRWGRGRAVSLHLHGAFTKRVLKVEHIRTDMIPQNHRRPAQTASLTREIFILRTSGLPSLLSSASVLTNSASFSIPSPAYADSGAGSPQRQG